MNSFFERQLLEPIVIDTREVEVIFKDIIAPPGEPAVTIPGEDARLIVAGIGSISAADEGNTAVQSSGEDVSIVNRGEIFGDFNGIVSTGDELSLINIGTISSNSRAVDLAGGDDLRIINLGSIIGTGDQRNGTLYIDGDVDDATVINSRSGVIDAGEGNTGDGLSVQVGELGEDALSEDIDIINFGRISGRGQPEFEPGVGRLTANGSSGVRFVNGSGEAEASVTGSLTNSGTIESEAAVGFLGGVVIEDGVAFDGTIANRRSGVIQGVQNGLYLGNAEHDLEIANSGLISSDSRAVNLDGDNVSLINSGDILGTGDQRNGTVYIDGTADDISITNRRSGVIDAGEGNLGDGISVQVGAAAEGVLSENINIFNDGLIQGRGDGPEVFADGARVAANGSSGVRFFNGSGEPEAIVSGSLTNSGTITAEVSVGFLGGVVVEDGVAFEGTITNTSGGLISGPNNGLYLGNAEHSLTIDNKGTITSDSRAVNLDGDNISLVNSGDILGTGDQRNGTVYIDGTGDDIAIANLLNGVIDAGAGNSGSGVSIQVGAAGGLGDGIDDLETSAELINSGLIQGRGDGNVPAGVRLFVGSGLEQATFVGQIVNESSGQILSEEAAGILIETGTIFDGTIVNDGEISGGNGIAIDAAGALGSVVVINNGELDGEVLLGQGDDIFIQNSEEAVSLIDGGDGTDTLDLSGQSEGIAIDLDLNTPVPGPATQDGAILDAPGGNVITEVIDFENVIGTDFNDLIFGNNEINVLEGGNGNDTIHSFAGSDTLDGGDGIDTALFTAGGGVTVDLDDDGNGTSSFGDTLISIENINGSGAGDDDISGNSSANVLNGQGGNDTLDGEGGADTLLGGTGDDLLTGGADLDTFLFEDSSGNDIVTDFTIADDVLDVSAFFDSADAALGAAIQVGSDTLVDFGNSNSALLLAVNASDLTAANFIVALTP